MTRLDQFLVEQGHARSRTQAKALIASGSVSIAGAGRVQPSTDVRDASTVTVSGASHYVGRAALKLHGALHDWPGLAVQGRVALDAGASTGGFTQVLLEAGARHVFAVDVGHGQLVAELAQDPRVSDVPGVNLRSFSARDLVDGSAREAGVGPADVDLVVGDISFISLTLVLPRIVEVLAPRDLVMLIKPQFEVGRGRLNSGGVVAVPERRREAIETVLTNAEDLRLETVGLVPSRLVGATGNREYLSWLRPRGRQGQTGQQGQAAQSSVTEQTGSSVQFDWRGAADRIIEREAA